MSGDHVSDAPSIFFDHFGLRPDGGLLAVESIVHAFSALPWENLTKYLRKIQDPEGPCRPRDPMTVMTDHVELGAGGTCFSLTATLAAIIKRTGLDFFPVMADMNHARDIHCALLIRSPSGLLLADPGYLVPEPVLLHPGRATVLVLPGQLMSWEPAAGGSFYDLYTEENGIRQWRYRLKTAPVEDSEFRRHWETSFDSPGMNSLHLNRRVEGGRISAHNDNLRIVEPGTSRNEKLSDDFAGKVSGLFGLDGSLAEKARREWSEACRAR